MIVNVKIKKLDEKAITPIYSSSSAAGADLYALNGGDIEIKPNTTVLMHTQIAMEIPEGLVGLVYARSGLATKHGIAPANKVGVIDSDYRGEIMVPLHNHSNETFVVKDGDRIAQLVLTPYITGNFEEVKELNTTERNQGGFGSTGKN